MTKFLTALPLFAALTVLVPAAAFAQTATPPAADGAITVTETEAPETGETKTEDLLSLGEDANAAPAANPEPVVGQPYTREVIGSWEMRCLKAEEGEEPCQMYQLMNDGENVPVAEVSLFRLPDGGKAVAGATIIVPLETALTQQLTLSIDGGKARRYPYAFCNPVGCYVRLGLTAEDIAAFKRGKQATMTIVPALAPDQKVALTLSLAGFTASYDKVSVLDQ
ncbi:invasion associated locus B family protein [Sulfitobacter guttiformis]|uniref:Invasion protein IalB n=1 Tax=Sulfitobacter guttiformis TaxID=74349 RepID=A0A420DHR8_9RHOB|nr:invasion associated locus B family protein [Sulfitobacter guttiformis]KIN72486.1 Invasion associated family protein [Sulfitobacter guttiformis KCTC 32187]RKE93764.1 invasion protein IalB [Sulfitobacter guttiformis]